MKKTTLAGVGIALALIAVLGTGTFSFGDGEPPCEFEKLELQGQTFDSFNQFIEKAKSNGAEYTESEVKSDFDFEEREDGLYYRDKNCGFVENE